jgi:superfamily I DNA/RNA helicase
MVDEYQDTNRPQYLLIKQVAGKHRNLAVVGDPDQSIYKWRGADIRNIMDFESDFSDAQIVKLEQNYRSTEVILDAASAVIANNRNRKKKTLWTDLKGGAKIKLFRGSDELEEAEYITAHRPQAARRRLQGADRGVVSHQRAVARGGRFTATRRRYRLRRSWLRVGFVRAQKSRDALSYLS